MVVTKRTHDPRKRARRLIFEGGMVLVVEKKSPSSKTSVPARFRRWYEVGVEHGRKEWGVDTPRCVERGRKGWEGLTPILLVLNAAEMRGGGVEPEILCSQPKRKRKRKSGRTINYSATPLKPQRSTFNLPVEEKGEGVER